MYVELDYDKRESMEGERQNKLTCLIKEDSCDHAGQSTRLGQMLRSGV